MKGFDRDLQLAGMVDGVLSVVAIDEVTLDVVETSGLPTDGTRPVSFIGHTGSDGTSFFATDSTTDGGPVFALEQGETLWRSAQSKLQAGASATAQVDGVVMIAVSDPTHGSLYAYDNENTSDRFIDVGAPPPFKSGDVSAIMLFGGEVYSGDASGFGVYRGDTQLMATIDWQVAAFATDREVLFVATSEPAAIWTIDESGQATKTLERAAVDLERIGPNVYAAVGADVLVGAATEPWTDAAVGLPSDGWVVDLHEHDGVLWAAVQTIEGTEMYRLEL